MRDPLHRVNAVFECLDDHVKPSKEAKALFDVMTGSSTDETLLHAWDLYSDPLSRTIMHCYLLSGATYDVIRDALGVPLEVSMAYVDHIFDTSVFRHQLDRIRYINQVKNHGSDTEARFYEAAVDGGPALITWMVSAKDPKMAPKDALQMLMVDAAYRAHANRHAPLTSAASKEVRSYMDTAVKSAAILQKIDPTDSQDALAELRIRLQFKDKTTGPQHADAPRPEDILH